MTALTTSVARPTSLKLVVRETKYQQLLFWRNRFGAVFTIIFSSLFLILLSATNSGHISSLYNIKYAQYYTPGFMAYGMMSASFNNLAIATVIRRETGMLKRLRLSPLPGWALIAAMVVSAALVSFAGAILLLLIGVLAFGVTVSGSGIVAIAIGLLVGSVSFSALGLAVSTFVPNEEAAGPAVSIVFFLLLFLSGLWFPLTNGSTLARISGYLPVRRIILVFTNAFVGHGISPWSWSDLLVVAIWGAVGAYIAIRRFKWARWKDEHAAK